MSLPLNLHLRRTLKTIYDHNPLTSGSALVTLIHEALAMEKALRFYADPDNWIDGVPQMVDHQDGLSTVDDDGFNAQWALHLVDVSYGPYLESDEAPSEAATTDDGGEPGGGGDGGDEERVDALDVHPILPPGDHGHNHGSGEGRTPTPPHLA